MDRWAHLLLRGGLAFAFLFPPLNALVDPASWIGYFPGFVRGVVPDLFLLHAFGALEIVLGIWILSGWRIRIPAILATLILLVIVLLDNGDFQVLFRDLSIATIGFALALSPDAMSNVGDSSYS